MQGPEPGDFIYSLSQQFCKESTRILITGIYGGLPVCQGPRPYAFLAFSFNLQNNLI